MVTAIISVYICLHVCLYLYIGKYRCVYDANKFLLIILLLDYLLSIHVY